MSSPRHLLFIFEPDSDLHHLADVIQDVSAISTYGTDHILGITAGNVSSYTHILPLNARAEVLMPI
jgi:hypothetical protein